MEEEPALLDDPMVRYGVPAVLLFIIAMVLQLRRRMQGGYEESILNVKDTQENTVMDKQLEGMMGDAPACTECGHITVRNASCYKCLNCGSSMGCS